jgi:hypothetical protein
MPLTLTSPAFADGDRLPRKYAREDRNLSPPLRWTGVPEGTESLALALEDPEGLHGTVRHWLLYNLEADRRELPESVETGPERDRLHVARNDFGHRYYDGPEPPEGDPPHRCVFRLAALSVPSLSVPADAGAAQVWDEALKHAIEIAELAALYQR